MALALGLTDRSGHRFSLLVFEQPDPAFPAGWRLRVNALAPCLALDHNRPLQVSDGMGALWSLPNRSEELVETLHNLPVTVPAARSPIPG